MIRASAQSSGNSVIQTNVEKFMMDYILSIMGNYKLKTKILGVSFLFLIGMVVIIIIGGYKLHQQTIILEEAILTASKRVNAASDVQVFILEIDRTIQALIATDDNSQIRKLAIASIRSGAALDEKFAVLKETFGKNSEVEALVKKVTDLRPRQMKIIGKARKNKDDEALKMADAISPEFNQIRELAAKIVSDSQKALEITMINSKESGLNILKVLGGLSIFGVILGFIIALLANRMMTGPLGMIERTLRGMSEGDLTIELDCNSASKDEIGQTIAAICVTQNNLRKMLEQISVSTGKVAHESEEISQNADNLKASSEQIDSSIDHINSSAENVVKAAVATSDKAEEALQSALKTSETAVKSANQINSTVENFNRFQTEMDNTVSSSRELADIIEKITDITTTISGISEQTNLLALNAAIEAARAGEQGRGFAVVADEVRSLAGRSSEAVDEISALVTSIDININKTISSIEKARDNIVDNIGQLGSVSSLSHESSEQALAISNSMKEVVQFVADQRNSISEISNQVTQLKSASQNSNEQADTLYIGSEKLQQASTELNNLLEQFKV